MALATATGLQCGWNSPLFAIAAILAIIVMHDATGVRQETGKQAKVINDIVKTLEARGRGELTPAETLKEFVGHTGPQVLVGALGGIMVAVIMNTAMHSWQPQHSERRHGTGQDRSSVLYAQSREKTIRRQKTAKTCFPVLRSSLTRAGRIVRMAVRAGRTAAGMMRKHVREESPGSTGQG